MRTTQWAAQDPNPSKNNDSKKHKPSPRKQYSESSIPSSETVVQKEQKIDLGIWNGDSKVLEGITLDYSFEPKRLEKPVTKFWTPSLKQEILSLAYHAAPLDQLETYIKKAHARKERHLRDTLVEATVEAIKNGDVTLKDEKGNVLKDENGNIIAEGMAEKLMELHDALYPKDTKCIDKVKPKLPVEDEKEKKAREEANVAAVTQVFEAIRLNDLNTTTAIKNFQELVGPSTLLNRIHLLFVAFDVLARRGGELPSIEGERYGQWWGKLADRFCFEVIGAGVEKDLPPRIQQLLKTGLYYVLNGSRIVARDLDVGGLRFHGAPGSGAELGVNCYYDDIAPAHSGRGYGVPRGGRGRRFFNTYYEHLHQYSQLMRQTISHTELSLVNPGF